MIPLLDKVSIMDTLLPTMGRIKTREPSVMVASLAVYEALCEKVDLETKATVILPRLWVMAMCPLLNETQFHRFIRTIKSLGETVEQEQLAHIREASHLEVQTNESAQQSASNVTPIPLNAAIVSTGDIDLEALVGHARYETSVQAMENLLPSSSSMATTTSTPSQTKSMNMTLQTETPARSKSSNTPDMSAHNSTSCTGTQSPGLFDALVPSSTRMLAPPSTVSTQLNKPQTVQPPPGWSGGMLTPESKKPTTSIPKNPSKAQWQDFDPLK